jgi:hypothetical protein
MNKAAQQLGKLGGKASVEKRFKGLSKEQVSELMKKVRKSRSPLEVVKINLAWLFLRIYGIDRAKKRDGFYVWYLGGCEAGTFETKRDIKELAYELSFGK